MLDSTCGVGVRILIDRPALAAILAQRGAPVGDDVLVVPVDAVDQWRRLMPMAALLAVAADALDEARALDADADDSVAADAPDALLAARAIRLLHRRAAQIVIGDLAIDHVARTARRAGVKLALLPREFALLDHLARHAGRTVPREELLRAVFGLRFDPGTNVLAVHASRLRRALDHGFDVAMLVTDRGRGYRLVAAPDGVD